MTGDKIVELSEALKGRALRIPSLHAPFRCWPTGISPHVDEVRKVLMQKLDEWDVDTKLSAKVSRIDIPLMISRYARIRVTFILG